MTCALVDQSLALGTYPVELPRLRVAPRLARRTQFVLVGMEQHPTTIRLVAAALSAQRTGIARGLGPSHARHVDTMIARPHETDVLGEHAVGAGHLAVGEIDDDVALANLAILSVDRWWWRDQLDTASTVDQVSEARAAVRRICEHSLQVSAQVLRALDQTVGRSAIVNVSFGDGGGHKQATGDVSEEMHLEAVERLTLGLAPVSSFGISDADQAIGCHARGNHELPLGVGFEIIADHTQ